MRSLKTLLRIGIPTLLIVAFGSFFIYFSSQAASLTAVYLFTSRIQANVSSGIEMILAVAPAQNMAAGGTITISFPADADTQWCRTTGSMTLTGIGNATSVADLIGTNWEIDSALTENTGGWTGGCTQGGGSSADTITITNVAALTAGTTYGVKIVGNTGALGTGTAAGQHEITVTVSSGAVIDSKTFKISLVSNDRVVVAATVSSAPSVNCSISSNSVNLGTLYPGGAYAIGSHTISTNTTSASGYYWAAYGEGDGGAGTNDAGLWKSTATTYLIRSGPNATLDLTLAGSEGFGLTVSDPDGGGGAVVPSNFSDQTVGTFGTLDRLYSGAKLILYQNGDQSSSENATITYGARAGASAQAGSYQETVTFICGGYY